MTKKKGLGKGLGALLSNTTFEEIIDEKDYIEEIDIKKIIPNIEQPRKFFSEESLESLKESINNHGVIQPIIVRKKGSKYEIIAGERRYRASQLAGKEKIPAIIKDMENIEVKKIALIENIQREDLTVTEEAFAYKSLIEEYNITQEELSKELAKSRSYIANTMRLLNLDENTLGLIEEGKITRGHGRALLNIPKEDRDEIVKEILEENINVREVEKKVKNLKGKKVIKKEREEDIYIKDLEDELMEIFGTKIKLNIKNNKGKIEMEFYDLDDLDRLLELLKNK